jgi:hypothetical protein
MLLRLRIRVRLSLLRLTCRWRLFAGEKFGEPVFPKIAGAEIRKSESKIVLELEEVNLVDLEVVGFCGTCDAQGATLLNCSALHTRLNRQESRFKK